MARFIKHVGKVGDRKIAVIFREVPGEDHMCLVVFTELLNQNIHDPLISTIESDIGQTSENLGDALNRSYTKDGKIILQVLHQEGMMKKVNTQQVLMTPAPNQSIRLNELNKILTEMSKGEAAVKKLAEMDRSRGLQDPVDVARRMRGESTDPLERQRDATTRVDSLADYDLASQRLDQARKMEIEANGLLNESRRLAEEAYSLDPSLAPKTTKAKTSVKKAVKTVKSTKSSVSIADSQVSTPRKAGRPRKVQVTG